METVISFIDIIEELVIDGQSKNIEQGFEVK